MIDNATELLDGEQFAAYEVIRYQLECAIGLERRAAAHGATALQAFRLALISGPSTVDPIPWRAFFEAVRCVTDIIGSAAFSASQRTWVAALIRLVEENSDLLDARALRIVQSGIVEC